MTGSQGVRQHGAYFIGNSILTSYLDPTDLTTNDGIADWVRTKVMEGKSGELYLIREHTTSTSIINLYEMVISPT